MVFVDQALTSTPHYCDHVPGGGVMACYEIFVDCWAIVSSLSNTAQQHIGRDRHLPANVGLSYSDSDSYSNHRTAQTTTNSIWEPLQQLVYRQRIRDLQHLKEVLLGTDRPGLDRQSYRPVAGQNLDGDLG